MDSHTSDQFDHIIERLERIEVKTNNQVTQQGLDTILRNTLENQNEILSQEVSNQLEQQNLFMRDQLQDAQNEILRRLTELQEKSDETTQLRPTSGRMADPSNNTGDTVTETIKQHSINTSLDEFDDEMQKPVNEIIRTEFEQLKKHLENNLRENEQNWKREISRNTEIVSAQLHDFTEMTKAQLEAQTAGMDGKLGNINAANEDLRRHMLASEEKLDTIEQTIHQHVKDGLMVVVNELRNSAVTYLKTFFTKKTLVCLFLFSAVVLAIWHRSEGLANVKSQIIHQMDNTRAELVSVTSDSTQHIMDKLDNMDASVKSQITNQMDNTKAQLVSVNNDSTQHIMDKLDNMDASVKSQIIHQMDNTKAELVSVTNGSTQHIMDKLDTLAFSLRHLQYKETRNDQQNDSETVNDIHEAEIVAKTITMLEFANEISKEMRNMSFYGPILSTIILVGPVIFGIALAAVWGCLVKSPAAIPGLVLMVYILLYFASFLAFWYMYANPTGVKPHVILEIENMIMTHGSINNDGTRNFTNQLLELASELYEQSRNLAFYGPFRSFGISVARSLPFLFMIIFDNETNELSRGAQIFMSLVNLIFIFLSIAVMWQAWVLTPLWVV